MTATLNLSAETQRKLYEQAAQAGQTPEAYLEQLVGRATQTAHGVAGTEAADQLSPDEFDQRLEELAEGLPPFSTLAADWSRADLYADHD
jgi:hypothetical protein